MGRTFWEGAAFFVAMNIASSAYAWHVEPQFIAFCHEEDAGGTCVDWDVDNDLVQRNDLRCVMSPSRCMVFLATVDSVYDIWDIQAQAYDNLSHDRHFWEMMDYDIYYLDDDSRDVWRECSRTESYWNYYLSCWEDDDPDNQPYGFAYAEEGRTYFPAVNFTMHWWNNVSGRVTYQSAEIWVREHP